jgi:ATP-dependent protease ClpP protease subunit
LIVVAMKGVTVKAAATAPVLQLYGDVGIDVLATDVASALQQAGGRDVTVNLFSYGGDAGEGLAIHDLLARYAGKTTVVIDGVAASAGSMVAMAGDKVVMPDNALLMIHNCWSMAAGDAASMRSSADLLDTYSASYRATYAKKSGQSETQVMEWMSAGSGAGTWFTADAAKAAGLADEVAAPVDVRASVPRLPQGRFIDPPTQLNAWAAVDTLSPEESIPEPSVITMKSQSQAGGAPVATPEVQPLASTTPEAAPILAQAHEPVQAATESQTVAALRREADIRRCAAQASLSAEVVQAMVDNGKPFSEVAMDIVTAHAAGLSQSSAGHPARIQVTRDSGETVMAGIGQMLYSRINPGIELGDAGKQYRGYSLMECVRAHAESRGISTVGRSKSEMVAMAMHSTSDFPLLFSNLASKSLDAAYNEEPHTWKALARQRNLPDFKQASDLVIAGDSGLAPELLLEGGEYKKGTLKEAQATWKLATYARKISISRQAIINDDLSALERVPEYLGRGFRRLESNLVWALISGNATVSVDSKALFHADHVNTGTGVIGIAGMNAAKKAMRKQTDIGGVTINVTPDYLVVPSDLEATALQFLYPTGYAPSALTGQAGPNVYAGAMQLIVEPRLDGSAAQWYVAAGPSKMDGLVYGYLADEPGPTITPVPERDPDGLTILARFDFGCAVKDYRFIYRSSGV